eukprot:3015147-Rhodomonas_salina.1
MGGSRSYAAAGTRPSCSNHSGTNANSSSLQYCPYSATTVFGCRSTLELKNLNSRTCLLDHTRYDTTAITSVTSESLQRKRGKWKLEE